MATMLTNQRPQMLLALGFLMGSVACGVPLAAIQMRAHAPVQAQLYRFAVQPGSEAALARWIGFEHEHHTATLGTLEDEAMYAEAIFPDDAAHPRYLYWLAIHGTPKANAAPRPIDDEYRRLEAALLVKGSRTELPLGYALLSPFLQDSIDAHIQRH